MINEPAQCLLCNSTDTEHFLDARDCISGEMFPMSKCRKCGFVFVWPQPENVNSYYPEFYRQYHPFILRLFRFFQELRTRGWVKKLGRSGRALEVGCGHGWMLSALRRNGWKVVGIERTPQSAAFAANQLHLPILVGELMALKATGNFDLIVLHEVLEHLAKPMETVEACARLLKPGGRLILEVPNLDSWQFKFSRQHWEHLFVPRHLGQFTPETIRFALERVQLKIEEINYVSFEYDPFSWLESTLNVMGFPQNLLMRWLAGGWGGDPEHNEPALWSPTGLAMVLMILLLSVPCYVVSIISWPAKTGSIMEVRAIRPKS